MQDDHMEYDDGQDQMQTEQTTVAYASDVVVDTSKTRTTTPYMTKYERARVLGARALQIRYLSFPPPSALVLTL